MLYTSGSQNWYCCGESVIARSKVAMPLWISGTPVGNLSAEPCYRYLILTCTRPQCTSNLWDIYNSGQTARKATETPGILVLKSKLPFSRNWKEREKPSCRLSQLRGSSEGRGDVFYRWHFRLTSEMLYHTCCDSKGKLCFISNNNVAYRVLSSVAHSTWIIQNSYGYKINCLYYPLPPPALNTRLTKSLNASNLRDKSDLI